ncbi:hypothetical protein KKC13_06370 [bacterium]|nr:hypothetical protein [bacterium]MBU1957470.1 hypothetical protein [bacterium]
MKKTLKFMGIVIVTTLFSACVPQPQLGTSIGGTNGGGASSIEYGARPSNYVTSIQSYFSTKLPRAQNAKYKFSQPKRAYKRKGLAYGGEVDWKGWLVETSIATPSRTGKLLTPKPYMVLFTGNQIVEHILGNSHKLLTKVDR